MCPYPNLSITSFLPFILAFGECQGKEVCFNRIGALTKQLKWPLSLVEHATELAGWLRYTQRLRRPADFFTRHISFIIAISLRISQSLVFGGFRDFYR